MKHNSEARGDCCDKCHCDLPRSKDAPSIEKEGIAILHPPPADVKSVAEALASPTKTRVSVRGKIVQVSMQAGEKETHLPFFLNINASFYFT